MNTRTCTKCNECLPESEFRLEMSRGKVRRKSECTACNRSRQRQYWQKKGAPQPKLREADPLNLLVNRWRGRVNRKEPLLQKIDTTWRKIHGN